MSKRRVSSGSEPVGVFEFTASQQAAIEYRRLDACVVAGPGSGKTTVLVERYRRLIEVEGFEPYQILAITFTEKAAANMKAKLAELFAHDALRLRDLESAWVSTIHGFCARLLKENAIAAAIDPRFRVLDPREQEESQYICLNAALDELTALRREEGLQLIQALHSPQYLANDLLNAWEAMRSAGKGAADIRAMPNPGANLTPQIVADNLRRLVMSWPANLTPARRTQKADVLEWSERLGAAGAWSFRDFVRLLGQSPLHLGRVHDSNKEELREIKEKDLPRLIGWAVDRHTDGFRRLIFDVLARFEEIYNDRKIARGVLDFNDLERHSVALLRRDGAVRERVCAQFRQVMLDEFQDINHQQSELIDLVRGKDVFFGVGDVNQSIYGFRHARPQIFLDYQAEIDGAGKHSVNLLDNFRSRETILRCVESLLNQAEGIQAHQLISGTSFAEKSAPSIEVLKIQINDDEDGPAKEAQWIAHRILTLRETLQLGEEGSTRPADFADFAVLCRNSDSMTPVLDAFDRSGIPYVCGRRQSFLLSREGRDITALLRVIANPRDTIALATVLRSPLVGLGDEALLQLRVLAGSLSGGLNRIMHDRGLLASFDAGETAKIGRFVENLKYWRELSPTAPLEFLLVRALGDCGFHWSPGTIIADNIESFLHLARTKGEQLSLRELLAEIESLGKAMDLDSDLSDKDQGNRVRVMTAHGAKGLEFPVTVIAAMDKGTRRNSAPVTFTPQFGLGIRWRDPEPKKKGKGEGLEDSWQLRNSEELERREKAEENRLLYVAMTRAEEHLILSYSRKKGVQNWAKIVDGLPESDDVRVFETAEEAPLLHAGDVSGTGTEILRMERPAVSGQHDTTVNVTSLAVFADCPRKYYLQRYIGWNGRRFSRFDPEEDLPEEDEIDMTAADLGSAVHEILAGRPGSYPAEAERLADVFRSSPLGARAAASARIEREWDFIIDIEGTLVRGTVDLWFEDGGEITLVDYKTDAQVNAGAYTPQLALYALAVERATGKRPAHAWLHFLRSDTTIEVPLDHPVTDLLAELRAAQDSLQFDLREGDHCHSCRFYRSMCPAGIGVSATGETELPAVQTPSQSAAAS